MDNAGYPSDLTDAQWALIEPLIPQGPPGQPGRPPKYPRRRMLEAMLYILRGGGAWRLLPANFPPWGSVWELYWRWREQNFFQNLNGVLRTAVRHAQGKAAAPAAAILDSQSVATTEKGGSTAMTRARRSKVASATC